MDAARELVFLRTLAELSSRVGDAQVPHKVVRIGLRLGREVFAAERACLVVRGDQPGEVAVRYAHPRGFEPDVELFRGVLAGKSPRVGHNPLLVPIKRRGRTWGALGFWRATGRFERATLREAPAFAKVLSKRIQHLDRQRLAEVRARIDGKMMEQLRPKDLFYEVLEGLRTLTRYDHSAGLLVPGPTETSFELVAEKVVWRKGKGHRIGLRCVVEADVLRLMGGGTVALFERDPDGAWRQIGGSGDEALARAFDYGDASREPDEVLEQSVLCAPLVMRDSVVGVLKIAARHPGRLGVFEADLVRRFLPQVAMAIRRMQRDESLATGLLEAEKKHTMANLARGVAHDVNGALGAVLPLVQQLGAEARDDRIDVATLGDDLRQIETSLQSCQRIFGGMLSFAKNSTRGVGEGNVRRAIDSTLAILGVTLRRQGVEVEIDVRDRLPTVRGGQGDLEQLVLNLATNARDAMPEGGVLSITARRTGPAVALEVGDTGVGIDPEVLKHVHEPFFTTKRQGHGLGLSICRSIVWNMRGDFEIDTEPGAGTRVRVRIPLASTESEAGE